MSKPMQVLCEENNLTNTFKREGQQSTDPYHWLAEDEKKFNR